MSEMLTTRAPSFTNTWSNKEARIYYISQERSIIMLSLNQIKVNLIKWYTYIKESPVNSLIRSICIFQFMNFILHKKQCIKSNWIHKLSCALKTKVHWAYHRLKFQFHFQSREAYQLLWCVYYTLQSSAFSYGKICMLFQWLGTVQSLCFHPFEWSPCTSATLSNLFWSYILGLSLRCGVLCGVFFCVD